jgi:hypothetical protein
MRSRDGVVLIAALLALLAMETVALGLLFLATREAIVARAHERALRVRLAAEDDALSTARALRDSAAAGHELAPEVFTPGAALRHDAIDAGAAALVSARWVAIRSTARDAAGAVGRAALLMHRPDPLRFLPAFETRENESADSLRAAALAELTALPALSAVGELLLGPVVRDGLCAIGATGNWGAPGEVANPCQSHVPLVRADDALVIQGGAGQAIFIVRGGAVISAGAVLDAAIVVEGRLEIIDGAIVRGAVTVLPGGELDGFVDTDPAVLHRLLTSSAVLRVPVRPERSWLPAFEH